MDGALCLAFWLRRQKVEIVNTHSSRDGWRLGLAARLARTLMQISMIGLMPRDAR